MMNAKAGMPDMKPELVPVPVSDVDRAKAFYEQAGLKLEVDARPNDVMWVIQFTPPGSAGCVAKIILKRGSLLNVFR